MLCQQCGCRHLILVKEREATVHFHGRQYDMKYTTYRCRHCGTMVKDVVKEAVNVGDIET